MASTPPTGHSTGHPIGHPTGRRTFGRRTAHVSAGLPALQGDSPPETKAGVARVMGEVLDADLSDEERFVAEDIVRILCDDAVDSVRAALARSVAASPQLPRSVAQRLALDIETVSIPVLEASTLLTDDILKKVIGKGTGAQVEATARRPTVSGAVSDAIVERGHLPAVAMVVRNPGAGISVGTWQKVIERHGDDEAVIQAATDRGGLPEPVAARLMQIAKAHVRSFVTRYLNVPPSVMPTIDDISTESGAGRRVMPVVPGTAEPNAYAEALHRRGRLDRRTLLQALCAGEFVFLTAALSRLTGLPFADVQQRLFSPSDVARQNLLERAGLEPAMVGVFGSLLGMGHLTDRAEYQRVALEKVSSALERPVDASVPA
jgi:uncharacterized protein (DUF2336 family)